MKFSHFDQFRFQPLYISNEFWNSLVISTGPPLGHSSSYFSRKWWFFKLVGNPGNSWNLAKRRKTKFHIFSYSFPNINSHFKTVQKLEILKVKYFNFDEFLPLIVSNSWFYPVWKNKNCSFCNFLNVQNFDFSENCFFELLKFHFLKMTVYIWVCVKVSTFFDVSQFIALLFWTIFSFGTESIVSTKDSENSR